MLQIRLSKPASESGGGAKSLPSDTVTVACPDHLVLADLPVAKSLGSANAASLLKSVGRRSRRQLGERVHFCVRCDFPIAIYGRLNPCEHAFCLDCARSDSLCYLCDERIQKIQTIKLMEGIFICAAPHCLKSFMKKTEFEIHIHENHSDLLHQTPDKDGNLSESASARKPAASESTVQVPPRPLFSPSSGAQVHDREDKAHLSQMREQPPRPLMQPLPTPPFAVPIQNLSVEQQSDNNPPPGFERPITQNQFPQQGMGGPPFPPEYPMHMPQPPGFAVSMSSNPGLAPQFGYHPQFTPDGAQPFYGASYEMPRRDSNPDMGSEQGSLLGFPPGAAPRQWNMGQPGRPFEPTPADGGFVNVSDPQGRASFFQGQSGNSMDNRDSSAGVLMPQPLTPLPPPPPLPHHMSQLQRGGRQYSGDTSHDAQGFGWQHDKRE